MTNNQCYPIKKIAVLLTSHNRKDQTIKCLNHLYESFLAFKKCIEFEVYLTDDGSTDGTTDAIHRFFPSLHVLKGDGTLYWAGGMRNSWKIALKKYYDAYLLLNDDTILELNCIEELINTHNYSMKKFKMGGIYIGSVKDFETDNHTYGGRIIINKWKYETVNIIPDGTIKECQLGNGNIMLVSENVVQVIGIFSKKYIHAKADFDYTLRAIEKNIPVLVCSSYCGYCKRDHAFPPLTKLSFPERIMFLISPKGIEFKGYMYYMWRFFPIRAPFVFCSLLLKTLFPFLNDPINNVLKR